MQRQPTFPLPSPPLPHPPTMLRILLLLLPLLAHAGEHTMNHPPLKTWLPDTPPRAVILALHSFGDYSAAFDHVGPWFAQRGYALYAWDQRGFGAHDNAGEWPGGEILEQDLLRVIDTVRAQHNGPLFVLGESLGGAVAINVAARNPETGIDGLVLLAPAVREGIRLRYGWNLAINTATLFRPGYLLEVERRADDPRFRPASAQRLATDPHVLREVRMDAYRGLIRYADRASDIAPALRQPVLLMYGGEDNSVPAISIQRLRDHLGEQASYRFYPEGPHLLLQGRQWEQVLTDSLNWLEQSRATWAPAELIYSGAH